MPAAKLVAMPGLHHHRRFVIALMLVSLVLASLAPGIARALSFARGDAAPWSVMCSTLRGMPGSPAPLGAVTQLLDHCPYCALHTDTLVPPPKADPVLLIAGLAHTVPVLFLGAPRPLHAWSVAQARAPPRTA